MHPKFDEWFNLNGRNYAMLRVAGGNAYIKKAKPIPNYLSGAQWAEFLYLHGQFEAYLAILTNDKLSKEVLKRLKDLEDEQQLIYDITGTFNLPKGYA